MPKSNQKKVKKIVIFPFKKFYSRAEAKASLDKCIKSCGKCEGMNLPGKTENAPGYGNVCSPIFFVGQSFCTQCMATQIPFTRGCGDILDEIFISLGKMKYDFFITNVVHCHPPNNRPSKDSEIKNCSRILLAELNIVKPGLVIALGADARRSVFKIYRAAPREEGKITKSQTGRTKLVWFYHPSYIVNRCGEIQRLAWKIKLTKVIKNELRRVS